MYKVKYFGMIADIANCLEETFQSSAELSVKDLLELVTAKYPGMSQLSYKVALNNRLASSMDRLNEYDEIALLPPFAGG